MRHQLEEARAAANAADEAGDEDAEDEARAKIKKLKKELKLLTGNVSKTEKKLQDAKELDAAISDGGGPQ